MDDDFFVWAQSAREIGTMRHMSGMGRYFPYSIQISRQGWKLLDTAGTAVASRSGEPFIVFARRVARALQDRLPSGAAPVRGGELNLYALLNRAMRHVITRYASEQNPGVLPRGSAAAGFPVSSPPFADQVAAFMRHFPSRAADGTQVLSPETGPDADLYLSEALLLRLAGDNPALAPFAPLHDDGKLAADVPFRKLVEGLERYLTRQSPFAATSLSLPAFLRAPILASPHSLAGQVEYLRTHWGSLLPPEMLSELVVALDIVRVETQEFAGGPGRPQVLEFLKGGRLGREGYDYPEYERFSLDADWMANVVMIAKMTYVWLGQLSRQYGRPVERLDQVPDEELDRLARWGFTALWLIGVWERSPASQKIKQLGGNPDAIASAYSLYDYVIARDLGGEVALENLKERCGRRGIRLASDMVPNHTGIFSRWTVEHPDWFVQLDYPPYPGYEFTGPDLSSSPEVSLVIEDGYWTRRDAAVVFKHYDHRNGRTRYIYHGNDGTSTPWNDTAQLNYLLPEVREAVIQTILHVARQFPVIRFDAAMTLAKKHYQRLWFPQPGHGSGIPSRAEHGMTREAFDAAFPEEFWREVVDRVAAEAPGTLLLAEAFWLMEGYFVRTLGMHRVYNSAFMNMLKMEENAKYRQTVKNVLEFDPEILKRFVNFMNNPDERTAVEQFGKEGKYFGACVLLVTMPGLPMIGHGQIEGYHEKYGMEYRRAFWDEPVDEHLLSLHEQLIFPLMRRRWLFSGSQHFVFYDFFAGDHVNEDVFAYSNRQGAERGLVIYHNRFADTAGWVRSSTARAVKGEGGETRLVQQALGEALGFDGGDGVYYAFRDYASGLEYLRAGRELCERGLFVELTAYQYYAFLDFREILDNGAGAWAELCRQLDGRAVVSLDEEVKQIRFAPLIARYRALVLRLSTALSAPTTPVPAAEPSHEATAGLPGEWKAFIHLLGEAGLQVEPQASLAALRRGVALFGRLRAAEPAEGTAPQTGQAPGILPVSARDQALASALLLLGVVVAACPESSDWVATYGLDRATADLFRDIPPAPDESASLDPEAAVCLLRLLLEYGNASGSPAVAGHTWSALLFSDPRARQFLFVHAASGVEWFNRERWELLCRWLCLTLLLRRALREAQEEALAEALDDVRQMLTALLAIADEAGYRVAAIAGETGSASAAGGEDNGM